MNKHNQKNISKSTDTKSIKYFFVGNPQEKYQVAVAVEYTMAFHGAKYSLGYFATDCARKLFSIIFLDSKIAEKYFFRKIFLRKNKNNENRIKYFRPRINIITDLKTNHSFSISPMPQLRKNI